MCIRDRLLHRQIFSVFQRQIEEQPLNRPQLPIMALHHARQGQCLCSMILRERCRCTSVNVARLSLIHNLDVYKRQVSLFALIFSIGILVDDAIVVVENIHRHIQLGGRSLVDAIPLAVDEVGGPTILATFTVIAALLPMAFVSGLMGPYMSPIPINSSMGMLISLAVAFVFTPWLTYKVLRRVVEKHQPSPPTPLPPGAESEIPSPPTPLPPGAGSENFSHRLFRRVVGPFLRGNRGRPLRWLLGISVLLLIGGSVSLAYFELVVLKMLPFDNKSEFQVIVDMPEGTTLEQTARVLGELGRSLSTLSLIHI